MISRGKPYRNLTIHSRSLSLANHQLLGVWPEPSTRFSERMMLAYIVTGAGYQLN